MIWIGTLVFGFLTGFKNLGPVFYIGQAAAVLLAFLVDYAANIWGVRRFGGSAAALWGSVIGILLGIFLFGPFGIILGPFAGAVAGELVVRRSLPQAIRVGIGTLVGFLGATALKLVLAAIMITWFFIAAY